jgi:hypothetical protein
VFWLYVQHDSDFFAAGLKRAVKIADGADAAVDSQIDRWDLVRRIRVVFG